MPTDIAQGTNNYCGLYYRVLLGDYCNLVCIKFSITLDDFVFLNTAINSNCTNLYANESYCVAPVGNIDNYPGHPGFIATSTVSAVAWSSFPTATFVPPVLNITADLPIANGTRSDCYLLVDGSDLQVNVTGTFFSSACDALSSAYGITLGRLQNWNPSLDVNKTSCAPDPNYRYCMSSYNTTEVAPETSETEPTYPIRDGSLTNCTDYAAAVGTDTCADILNWYNLTIAEFYSWNPEVTPDCSNLWLEYSYCVSVTNSTGDTGNSTVSSSPTTTSASPSSSTSAASPTTTAVPPGPTQPGQPSNCDEWYVAKSGDSCYSVETAYHLTDTQFHEWNPAVSADCLSGFWANEAYCVGISGNSPS